MHYYVIDHKFQIIEFLFRIIKILFICNDIFFLNGEMVYAGRILPKSRSHRPEFRSIWLCFRSVNRTVNRKKKPFKSDDAVLIRIRKLVSPDVLLVQQQ